MYISDLGGKCSSIPTERTPSIPKTIDKSKPVFSSLIANDKNTAVIQKQLNYLFAYMKEWISTPDVYLQTGVMLMKTITFFSFLERFADETEKSLKNRFAAIFVRNHDSKWGTPFDVKNVFKQYFPSGKIYLVENTNKIDDPVPELANLLLDGDIGEDTPTDWTLVNCTASADARFSKSYGIKFNQAGGTLSQNVELHVREDAEHNPLTTSFFLHFFLKGTINVQIKNSSGKYWDYENKEWKNSAVDNIFTTAVEDNNGNVLSYEWDNRFLYFTLDDTDTITVYFKYADVETYADYFRLFQKQPYSSFTVIAHFEGNTASKAFGLAAGDEDPNIETASDTPPQPRYGNYGYFDKSFLSGVPIGFAKDIYEDLLEYLRAQGVKAYLDILIKDYTE